MRPPTAAVTRLIPRGDSGLVVWVPERVGAREPRRSGGFAQSRRPPLPLAIQVQRYYGTDDYDRVWTFNHAERHFNLDAYLSACP
jgi:hypothetical protein